MKNIPFTSNISRDPQSIFVITIETIIFGVSGIILGIIVDKLFIMLSKKYKNYKIPISILQIVVSGLVLGIMYIYVFSYFTNHFQRTLSEIVFPALFYGVQSNIFSTWRELY